MSSKIKATLTLEGAPCGHRHVITIRRRHDGYTTWEMGRRAKYSMVVTGEMRMSWLVGRTAIDDMVEWIERVHAASGDRRGWTRAYS